MICPLPRELHRGMTGDDVLMVKRAISRAGLRRWGLGFTTGFGWLLVSNIKTFQKKRGLTADGVYGAATHKKLMPYFDAYGASVMVKLAHDMNDPIETAVAANLIAHNFAWQNAYTQDFGRRMQIVRERIRTLGGLRDFFRRGRTLDEDCSSFQTGAAFIGGMPDPNGLGYNGNGYTGTLALHGVRVSSPKKGDLGFYGWGWPYHHVVRALEDGTSSNGDDPLVGSHGRPGFDIERVLYRSDFSHWRRYPTK